MNETLEQRERALRDELQRVAALNASLEAALDANDTNDAAVAE